MLIDELEEIYQKRQAIEKLYYSILRKKKELGNIKAIDYSKEKLQGGQIQDGNKLLNDIIHNEELEERLTEHIQDLKLKQAFLYLKIDKLSKFLSNDIRLILISRYVLGGRLVSNIIKIKFSPWTPAQITQKSKRDIKEC